MLITAKLSLQTYRGFFSATIGAGVFSCSSLKTLCHLLSICIVIRNTGTIFPRCTFFLKAATGMKCIAASGIWHSPWLLHGVSWLWLPWLPQTWHRGSLESLVAICNDLLHHPWDLNYPRNQMQECFGVPVYKYLCLTLPERWCCPSACSTEDQKLLRVERLSWSSGLGMKRIHVGAMPRILARQS